MSGKGWAQRPMDKQKFDESFDRIFGKPKTKEKIRVSGVPYEVEVETKDKDEGCQPTSSSSQD